MKIEMWPIDRLIPYARNPRNNASAVDSVAASLKEFGWRQPIVADPENIIIVGHTRYLAAKKLQMAEVPVHVARNLTKAQIRAYRIADNRTSEFATWDTALLALEMEQLRDLDYDIQLTGFGEDDLSSLLHEEAEPLSSSSDETKVKKPATGAVELDPNDFSSFAHQCPKCGFEFDEK